MFANLSDRSKIILQLAFVAALCAAIAIVLIAMGAARRKPNSHELTFRVEATGGFAVITLQAGNEIVSKPATVSVPWTKTVVVPTGQEVYLTASNPTQTGKISCTITLDKGSWKSMITTAPKNGVACAGIVP